MEILNKIRDALKEAFNQLAGRDPAAAAAQKTDAETAMRVIDLFLEKANETAAERERTLARQGETISKQAEDVNFGQIENAEAQGMTASLWTEPAGSQEGNGEEITSSRRTDAVETITVNSTEQEREAILREKGFFIAAIYDKQAENLIANNKDSLESRKRSLIKEVYRKAADEFNLPRNLYNDDMDMNVVISYGTLDESVQKNAADPADLVRLLPAMQQAVKNAVGIEVHNNRYFADDHTLYFANLLGGFIDNDMFVPIRFGIKASKTGENNLYVIISDQKIKKSEVVMPVAHQKDGSAGARSDFTISIPLLAAKVNSPEIVKYLPDGLLSERQMEIKWQAIADTIRYTNDKNDRKFREFIEKGNLRAAAQIVKVAAKAAGYDMHLYHGAKKGGGFTVFKNWQYFTESKAYAQRYTDREKPGSLYNVYVKADRLFDTRRQKDRRIFERFRNEYGMGEIMESGLPDWTDGYDLSDIIEENNLPYDGIVLDEGGDMTPEGPVSRGPSYVIRQSNQIKSADPVTYDDEGNVIPLSERFNAEKEDIRWSKKTADAREEMDEATAGNKVLGQMIDVSLELLRKAHNDLDKAEYDAWLQEQQLSILN